MFFQLKIYEMHHSARSATAATTPAQLPAQFAGGTLLVGIARFRVHKSMTLSLHLVSQRALESGALLLRLLRLLCLLLLHHLYVVNLLQLLPQVMMTTIGGGGERVTLCGNC